jgi:hypothetical protein
MPQIDEQLNGLGQMYSPEEVFGAGSPDDPDAQTDETVEGVDRATEDTTDATEENPGAPADDAGDTGKEPAVDGFKIGDDLVPRAEIEKAYEGREFIEPGQIYANALEHFNSGPEGAAAVIEQFINAAREHYADKFLMPDLPAELDDETLTDAERILNAKTKRLEADNRQLRAEFAKTLAELRDTAKEKFEREASTGWVATVKSTYPDAEVSSDQLTAWMREFKTQDPVAAYRLGTYDQVRAGVKTAEPPKTKEKPLMPRGGSGDRHFDPYDPNLSLADYERMIEQGMTPDPTAKRR